MAFNIIQLITKIVITIIIITIIVVIIIIIIIIIMTVITIINNNNIEIIFSDALRAKQKLRQGPFAKTLYG